MGELAWRALSALAGNFIAAVVLLPVGLIFLAYLVYIVVMTIRELRKNEQRQGKPAPYGAGFPDFCGFQGVVCPRNSGPKLWGSSSDKVKVRDSPAPLRQMISRSEANSRST